MKALLLALALLAGAAGAQPIALPAPPQAAVVQRPGARLPLQLPLRDQAGRAVRLGDFFHGNEPVLLVPGYYSCPELCGLVMHGLLQALHSSGLAPGAVRIVRVSIDPQDTPATAAAARSRDLAYASFLGGAAPDLTLLVGRPADTAALARSVGYAYETVPAAQREGEPAARYAHPAAVIVATPGGTVSRYFMGVQIEPSELRASVNAAAGGGVGSLTDQIALLCAHFDPSVGRHTGLVMNLLRVVGVLMVVSLAGWSWHRRGGRGAPR